MCSPVQHSVQTVRDDCMDEPVDLRRLQVLRMVEAHGSVTAAASALHLTPSAVSHQLRQLGRHVGMPLTEPDGRGIRLTAAGRRLVGHADDLLAGWASVAADMRRLAGGEVGSLRLGGTGTAIAALLAPVTQRLRKLAPEVQVRLIERDADTLAALLLQGEVDIAVTTPPAEGEPASASRYHQTKLFSEPFDLLVATDHPLANHTSVPLLSAAHEPWILASPGTWNCRNMLTAACATAGFQPDIVHEASSPLAVSASVSAGLGVSLVPRLVPLPAHHAVRRLALQEEPRPRRHVVARTLRGRETDAITGHGLELLRELARDLPPRLIPEASAIQDEHSGSHWPHRHRA